MTDNTDGISTTPITIVCKVIPNCDELPRSNKKWTRAKRCKLIIDTESLSFNDISIPFEEIENATLRIYQSALFLEYGILSLTHKGNTHHFGITYSGFWKNDLPFAVERIQEETPFLNYRKILIIVLLIYVVWEILMKLK